MMARHPDWDDLWKQIQDLLQHNPAWLRKNINRRVKQIVCSTRFVKQRQTNVASKHPDWNRVWEKVQNGDSNWLLNYVKSHDLNQCTDEQGNTLLHRAVRDKEIRALSFLCYLFIDPNIKNAAGQTALQLAQDTHPHCLYYLHRYHLCIDFAKASSKPNGLDALFAAIYRGDATLGDTSGVKSDGNEGHEGGWTALQCAVVYDRPHLIRALHQRFPKLDADRLNYDERSALRLAAMHGHSNCIIALCECFPAIKADDALQAACKYNRPACILTLRQCFPQLTGNELTNNYSCSSALMRAAFYNNPGCIRALHSCFPDIDPNLQDEAGYTALIASAMRSPECISALSECFPDIDPNKQDNNGDTALMRACERGLPQSITSLVTYFPSTDVNMLNTDDKTALMLVIERGDDEEYIVALCESFPNIDPNIQCWYSQTALMVAVRQDNPEPIISQLHKFLPNIDPNIQDESGQTALMIAAAHYNPGPIMSQLCKVFPNIDPNKQDEDQNTALMCMLQSCFPRVEYVRQFLDTFPNVDVKIQNTKGETALALAIEKGDISIEEGDISIEEGDISIVALLLERFPDIISLTNSAGQTALMLATKKNNTELISMLLKHIAQMQ